VATDALARPSWRQRSLVFVFWLLVTLAFIFPSGPRTTFSYCCNWVLPLTATVGQIQDHLGQSDGGSYARLGIQLAETGRWTAPGSAPLWSPGMPAIYAMIYLVVGKDGPAALLLALISAVAWAAFCYAFAAMAFRYSGRRLAWAAPALLFLVPATTSYLMKMGMFFSETISTAFCGIGICLLLGAAMDRSLARGALAGAFLIGSGLIRNAVEIASQFIFALTVGLVVLALLVWLSDCYWRPRAADSERRNPLAWIYALGQSREIAVLVAAMVVFQAGATAYRLNNYIYFKEFRWSFTDYYLVYPWLTDAEFSSIAEFIRRGGGNLACKIDQDACERFRQVRASGGVIPPDVYRNHWYATVVRHPVAWLEYKVPIITEYWMSQFAWGGPVPGAGPWAIVDALALPAACILLIIVLCRNRDVALFAAGTGLLGGFAALVIVVHLEVRYLIPLQVLGPVFMALCLARLFPLPQPLPAHKNQPDAAEFRRFPRLGRDVKYPL